MNLADSTETTYYRPHNLDELDGLIERTDSKLTYLAGATDLMVRQSEWNETDKIVDLTAVVELNETIINIKDGIQIGASVVMGDLIHHPAILEKIPILVETLQQIGSVQIQNRATLGGNISNASPAGDSLPVLNVLNAEVWIGPRINGEFAKNSIDKIMAGPGTTFLKNNQYIAFIYIPFPKNEDLFYSFKKVGQREALAISKLSLAVLGWIDDGVIKEIRISPGAVTPIVSRAFKTENFLNGKKLNEETIEIARDILEGEISPISDIRSNIEYRKGICGNLLREILYSIIS
ncbi:hypothetical protein B6I21_03270 [candidate division KSB1 bacterium 4572_119]|nr:MAG: hypothetical protein B6I21_03270 [candidate division KSB1 bacterium 4572_119]